MTHWEHGDDHAAGRTDDRSISVVIPTRNRAALLGRAIRSVLASPLIASGQQIIVVDDDSNDETPQVSSQLGVRYRRVACHAPSGARNAGFQDVDTPFVAFLDDDDEWLPNNMQAQLAALRARPSAALAYGITQCATEDLEPLPWSYPTPPLASGSNPEQLYLRCPGLGVVLFRREAIQEVGGFDLSMGWGVHEALACHKERRSLAPPTCEDDDLMLRIAVRHDIVGVESIGMLYRMKSPSRARSDYHWAVRSYVKWRPRYVGWKSTLRWQYQARGGLYRKFCQDADACILAGELREATVSFTRALRIAPLHAIHDLRLLGPLLWRICHTSSATRLAS
jgi:glycosyltransferase involved in cell wall biosynthesis